MDSMSSRRPLLRSNSVRKNLCSFGEQHTKNEDGKGNGDSSSSLRVVRIFKCFFNVFKKPFV